VFVAAPDGSATALAYRRVVPGSPPIDLLRKRFSASVPSAECAVTEPITSADVAD
jgi:hypothetical protein